MEKSVQGFIQDCARAGLVTHTVAKPESVDSVFAISKLQKLPEVHFAAAFSDGVLAIGCPNGLPAALDAIAHPIESPGETLFEDAPIEPEPHDDAPDLTEKLSEISNAISALQERSDLSSLETRLDEIAAQFTQDSGTQTHEALEKRLSALEMKIETGHRRINSALENESRTKEIVSQLETIQGTLAALAAQEPEPDASEAIGKMLSDLKETLVAEFAAAQKANDPTAHLEVVRANHAALLEKLSEPVVNIPAMEDVQTKLATLAARPDPVIPPPPDLAPLESAIRKMTDDVSKLSARPVSVTIPPSKDAGKTREALDRIEHVLEKIAASETDLTPLQKAQHDVLSKLSELSALTGKMHALTAHVEGIGKTIASTKIPDPDVAVAKLQGELVSRFEKLDTAIGNVSASQTETEQNATVSKTLIDHLAQLESGVADARSDQQQAAAAQLALAEQLNNLETSLHASLSSGPDISHELDELRTAVLDIRAQPTPVLDLAPQRQSFAQFGAAMGTIVSRLEKVSTVLSQAAESTPPPTSETDLLTPMEALRRDIAEVSDAQKQLTTDLRTELAAAASQPAPTIDLTAQRQGFARFGTALAMALDRFEHIVDRFDREPSSHPMTQEFPQSASNAKHDGLDKSEKEQPEVGFLAPANNASLDGSDIEVENVQRHLEETDVSETSSDPVLSQYEEEAQESVSAAAPFQSDMKVSLSALRHSFAEVIALQIRDNTQAMKDLNGARS